MRLGKYNQDITRFRIMKEFGWTPNQLAELGSKQMEKLILIMQQQDSIAETERRKIEAANSRRQ